MTADSGGYTRRGSRSTGIGEPDRRDMDVLQEALNEAIAKLPGLFLQNLISKKLHEKGITPPKGLLQKMAEHFLAGNRGPFRYDGRNLPKNVKLTFTDADAEQIEQTIERFCNTQLPTIITGVARRTATSVLKDLKSRWSNERSRCAWHAADDGPRMVSGSS
jgi:hypothetical protein